MNKLKLMPALLTLALVLCTAATAMAADKSAGSVDITYKITIRGEKPQSFDAKVWFTKDNARIESAGMPGSVFPKTKGGGKNIVIVNGLKMVAYAIIPGMEYAIMYKLESLGFTGGKPAGNPSEVLNPKKYPSGTKIAKTGSKTYKGAKVTVYTVTFTSKSQSPMTVYANSANLPVYISGKAGDAPYETTFKNYKFFKPEAKLFELPKNIPVVDMSALEQAMKG